MSREKDYEKQVEKYLSGTETENVYRRFMTVKVKEYKEAGYSDRDSLITSYHEFRDLKTQFFNECSGGLGAKIAYVQAAFKRSGY